MAIIDRLREQTASSIRNLERSISSSNQDPLRDNLLTSIANNRLTTELRDARARLAATANTQDTVDFLDGQLTGVSRETVNLLANSAPTTGGVEDFAAGFFSTQVDQNELVRERIARAQEERKEALDNVKDLTQIESQRLEQLAQVRTQDATFDQIKAQRESTLLRTQTDIAGVEVDAQNANTNSQNANTNAQNALTNIFKANTDRENAVTNRFIARTGRFNAVTTRTLGEGNLGDKQERTKLLQNADSRAAELQEDDLLGTAIERQISRAELTGARAANRLTAEQEVQRGKIAEAVTNYSSLSFEPTNGRVLTAGEAELGEVIREYYEDNNAIADSESGPGKQIDFNNLERDLYGKLYRVLKKHNVIPEGTNLESSREIIDDVYSQWSINQEVKVGASVSTPSPQRVTNVVAPADIPVDVLTSTSR